MPKKRADEKTPVLTKVSRRSRDAKTGMIRARVSPELKAQAEGILAEIGLSSSDAIRMFYKQDACPFPLLSRSDRFIIGLLEGGPLRLAVSAT